MNGQRLAIERVKLWDMPTMTRMAYANMTGADVEFTRMAGNPLFRALGYLVLPFYLATAGQGYKAVLEGRTVGCAFLHLRQSSGLVFNVSVNESYRRRGIGRALMKHLEAQGRQGNVGWLGLQVDEGNVPAQRLYLDLGYRPYHPYYFCFSGRRSPFADALPNVRLEALRGRAGHRLYMHYLHQEQEVGDAWAADVVRKDFADGPNTGGRFWRLLIRDDEAGCAWVSNRGLGPTVMFALKPTYWGEAGPTAGLLHLLFQEMPSGKARMNLFFGSSSHQQAVAPLLEAHRFRQQRRKRILMLKEI
ncbi:MAG: GNAT family N-acetyltransferase [Candidatus Promineifilaceae bacterium]|nr:GNAT family N-acetyltransferase [Candidatus Promineifilaceae bacterium]